MQFKRWILLIVVFLLSCAAFGQDLSQLPVRAMQLWVMRKEANKLDALQLIDPDTRKTYLQWNEPPILGFKVTGLEFTDDQNRGKVFSRVQRNFPQVGEMNLIIKNHGSGRIKNGRCKRRP